MSQLVLDRNARLLLQAKAHHLDPVVLLGGNGLTEAVIKEVNRSRLDQGQSPERRQRRTHGHF